MARIRKCPVHKNDMRSSCVQINFFEECFKEIDQAQERTLVYFSCAKGGGAFQ